MRGGSSATVTSRDDPSIQIDKAELDRLNQEMIVSDLITPDRLYVDLALVKDFNIGALLTFRDERKDDWKTLYQSILTNLPAYRARKFDDLAHHFPEFGVSSEEIRARIYDPQWSGHIFHNAPITPFINTLRSQIAVNVNHSAVISKHDPIDLTINTYPLQLNKVNQGIIGLYFADLLKVRVRVIYLDMTKLTLNDVLGYDEIYTYYFQDLFSHEDIRAGYSALKFIRKRLFVPRLFGGVIIPKMDTEQEERIVKSRCDVLTTLTFVPIQRCSAEAP